MAFDNHANFAYSTIASTNNPGTPTAATTVTVATSQGSRFPVAPFNAVICPFGQLPTPDNAEVVRVTAVTGDVLTITRQTTTETTGYGIRRSITLGDQIFAAITAKALIDLETQVSQVFNPSANFRISNGQFQIWDTGYSAWVAISSANGVLSVSGPISP